MFLLLTSHLDPLHVIRSLSASSFHDISFHFDESPPSSFSRLVLAAASPLLRDIFESGNEDTDISFVGYTKETVHGFLEFIAQGQFVASTETEFEAVQNLARNLKVPFDRQDAEDVKVELGELRKLDENESMPPFELVFHSDEFNDEDIMPPPVKRKKKYQVQNNEENSNFECTHCETIVSDRWLLIDHMRSHLGDLAAQCKECLKIFGDRIEWEVHKTEHGKEDIESFEVVEADDGKKPIKCEYCGKRVVSEWRLMVHQKIHIGMKAMECKDCGKIIERQNKWHYHKKIHQKDDSIVCEICGKNFKHKDGLKNHIKVIHKMTEYPFACEHCDKKFKTKGNWKLHQHVHSSSREYICDTCGHLAKNLLQLKNHKQTHIKDRPFKCDFCEKSFLSRYWLEEHRGTHTGDRPFQCQECDKAFCKKRQLDSHIKNVHCKDKFYCGICNATFKTSSIAEKHLIIHTDLKPFCCSACNARYNHSQSAKRHCVASHPGKKVKVVFNRSPELVDLVSRSLKRILPIM